MGGLHPESYISRLQVRQRISRAQPKGLPIINMGFNEMPYPPPQSVVEAISGRALFAHRYGSAACNALRQALALEHELPAEQLICGNGSEELIDVVGRCFVRPGDGIVISEYGYIQFSMIAHRLGAKLKKAPEARFTAQADSILAAVDQNTKLIYLANPNNPTGTLMAAEEVARLAGALPGNVVLVLDLAYGEFVGEDYCQRMHALVGAHENVVVTRTFSKVYGLAGVRIGWCHAPTWMMGGLSAARGMGSVNGYAERAALAALGEQNTLRARVRELLNERGKMFDALSATALNVVQSQTNFIMCGVPDENPALVDALVGYLFDEAGIVVGPVREEGLGGFVRFSLSLPEHNALALDVVRAFLEQRV
ncbi:MAG: histidinol-phosphate transaminase [Pseudomonadota bacterium]